MALSKLNEVLCDVLTALKEPEDEQQRHRLEMAAALLVKGGTPIGMGVLEAACACDEKNTDGSTALLTAVVESSDALECWSQGLVCLSRLTEAMDASFTARRRLDKEIQDITAQQALARKKLSGTRHPPNANANPNANPNSHPDWTRQNLASQMLAHKHEELLAELDALPTAGSLILTLTLTLTRLQAPSRGSLPAPLSSSGPRPRR